MVNEEHKITVRALAKVHYADHRDPRSHSRFLIVKSNVSSRLASSQTPRHKVYMVCQRVVAEAKLEI